MVSEHPFKSHMTQQKSRSVMKSPQSRTWRLDVPAPNLFVCVSKYDASVMFSSLLTHSSQSRAAESLHISKPVIISPPLKLTAWTERGIRKKELWEIWIGSGGKRQEIPEGVQSPVCY